MRKKRVLPALTVLMAAVFLFCAVMTARQQTRYQEIVTDAGEAARVAGLENETEPPRPVPAAPVLAVEPEEPPKEPLPEEAAHLAGMDLEALWAVNKDAAGWIEIPGTELSYPLMQGTDNQYYLSHNWKREASGGGSVFLEATSNRDLTDFHTIAYAHRMRNGTMFGTQKYYKKPDFWQEHPSVYLVTEAGIFRYDIFSAREASVTGIVYRLDLEESGLEEEFLRDCVENSVLDTGITPEAGDRILTLSTCTGDGHANRWVVHAVLAQVYQTPEADG